MSDLYSNNRSAQIGITTVFSILVLADLIGNSLVIATISLNKCMKTPMNFLLVNLAVADMMVATFIAFQFAFSHSLTHPDGPVSGALTCKLLTRGTFGWTGGAASVFSLVAISFERYFAVMHPYSQKLRLTTKKVKYIVVSSWIFACLLNIPTFLTISYVKKGNFCVEVWPKSPTWLAKAYTSTWFVVAGFLPVATMFVLYSRVINALWFKTSSQSMEGTQLAVLKSRKRITKMVVTVSIIYGLTWLPNLTIYSLSYHHPGYSYGDVTYICSIVLVTCNSAINPFIYTFQIESFRKKMWELIYCRRFCNNRVDATNTLAMNNSANTIMMKSRVENGIKGSTAENKETMP